MSNEHVSDLVGASENIQDFWTLIDANVTINHRGEPNTEKLTQALAHVDAAKIVSHYRSYWDVSFQAYTEPVWAAAYIILGGCSNDTFEDFRDWLICTGSSMFYQTVRNPDHLVCLSHEAPISDELRWAFRNAYNAKTGTEMPLQNISWPTLDQQNDFEDASQMKALLPQLFAKHWDSDE